LTDCEDPNDVLEPIAWFCGNSGGSIHEVGGKTPNAWLLYDMLGNLWEWCSDWSVLYSGDETDPWGAATGTYKRIRGGSCTYSAHDARAADRRIEVPVFGVTHLGFRPARTL
jgi:formylglycine-generating enzyme required for sulfatase activity